MATITKSDGVEILAAQSVASNTVLISAVQAVDTKLALMLHIRFGRRAEAALTRGVEFRVEVSSEPSGDRYWSPIAPLRTDIVAAASEAVSGTEAAGATVIEVASTTGFSSGGATSDGDLVYFDNPTIANSEWGRVKALVANTSLTLIDGLTNAQTGATIFNKAEIYPPIQLDLTGIKRWRLVVDASNSGQAVAVAARAVYGDSIG